MYTFFLAAYVKDVSVEGDYFCRVMLERIRRKIKPYM
jgi:hypothetical protein